MLTYAAVCCRMPQSQPPAPLLLLLSPPAPLASPSSSAPRLPQPGTPFTTEFTCFTSTQVHILTRPRYTCEAVYIDVCRQGCLLNHQQARGWRYSICLLYWYKSTNTDARGAAVLASLRVASPASCIMKLRWTCIGGRMRSPRARTVYAYIYGVCGRRYMRGYMLYAGRPYMHILAYADVF
jgi:hypothetical protein